MKGIYCNNSRELALGINECLRTRYKKYILRPFNRYNSEKTMWWIVPSTDYPAYKFGKYVVYENKNNTFTVGIHIEKGLNIVAGNNDSLTMDNTWVWHDFMAALKEGKIEELIRNIQHNIEKGVEIRVEVDIPELKERKIFLFEDGKFNTVDKNEAQKISSIYSWINNKPKIEWFWVDCYVDFIITKLQERNENEIDTYWIVENLLAPFEEWIR